MRRFIGLFVIALMSVMAISAMEAKAAPAAVSVHAAQLPALSTLSAQPVNYYGGGDYYGDEEDRHHKKGGYDYEEEDDDYPRHKYKYKYNSDGCCNKGCYKKKWVCESAEPRCRKERECVWYYGKEYCRYVRRCYGDTGSYCKWITVESNHCGCRRCW